MTARARSPRQDWILIGVLIGVVFVGGALTGYLLTRQSSPPAPPPVVASQPAVSPTHLQALVDEGKYAEVLVQGQTAWTRTDVDPRVFRCMAVAYLLSGDPENAVQAADRAVQAGLPAPDPAIVRAVKALALLRMPAAEPGAAKEAAEQAVVQTAGDPQAGLLAAVAYGAVLRDELDRPSTKADRLGHARRLRQILEPVYAFSTAEPKPAWQSRFWRHGLALLVDSDILASQAGDRQAEARVLAILRQCTPSDAWNCRFEIPLRAQLAVRQSQPAAKVDDHGRLAIYILAGLLYESAGDWHHADADYTLAMQACRRAMASTRDWQGHESHAEIAGQIRTVAAEYYTYRDCLDRLAASRGLRWGVEVVEGRANLEQVLASTDHPLFRTVVRLRADRQAEPLAILHAENLSPTYCRPLAGLLLNHLYGPQAEWEQGRALAVRDAAGELARLEKEGPQPADGLAVAGTSQVAVAGPRGAATQPGARPAQQDDLAAIATGIQSYSTAQAAEEFSSPPPSRSGVDLVAPVPDFDMPPLHAGKARLAADDRSTDTAPGGDVPQDLARELLGTDLPADADLSDLLNQVLMNGSATDPAKAAESLRRLAEQVAGDPNMSPEVKHIVQSLDEYLRMLDELTGGTAAPRPQPAPAPAPAQPPAQVQPRRPAVRPSGR